MKENIDYSQSEKQMGDLLTSMGVSIKADFSDEERKDLRRYLEQYMSSDACHPIQLDMKKFVLIICGADEASYLYQYIHGKGMSL